MRQTAQNCRYPNRVEVRDKESLKKAVSFDYVCAEYKGGYRSLQNFVSSDCLAFDIDNDHSDLPAEWVEPKDVAEAFPGVEFWVHYSRSNMQEKNGKEALYHVQDAGEEHDASVYTLVYSVVGEDTVGGDFMENIPAESLSSF